MHFNMNVNSSLELPLFAGTLSSGKPTWERIEEEAGKKGGGGEGRREEEEEDGRRGGEEERGKRKIVGEVGGRGGREGG